VFGYGLDHPAESREGGGMGDEVTRRQALARAGVAAVGSGVVLAALAGPAGAEPEGVQGTWKIEPAAGGQPAGFRALAAFAAGGVFLTTGSDEPGTGIGQWTSPAADRFAFTYLNFHFDRDLELHHTTKVRAAGTFAGGTLEGHATLTATDPHGHALFSPRKFRFTGRRMLVEKP
jgi:hypothetical protein